MLLAAAASAHEGAVFSLLAGSVARVGGPREALLLSASNYCPRVNGTKAPVLRDVNERARSDGHVKVLGQAERQFLCVFNATRHGTASRRMPDHPGCLVFWSRGLLRSYEEF